jgi:flagellar basal-body rod protein FlgG
MIQSLYTGASALTNHQRNIDVIGHNVANIGTAGFRASRLDFKDGLYRAMINPANTDGTLNLLSGTGLLTGLLQASFEQGPLTATGDPMDLALQGDGFFTFQSAGGEMLYSRVGALRLSNEADGQWIVSPQGHYVLDSGGNRIQFRGLPSQLSVDPNGLMSFGEAGSLGSVQLQIVDFPNKQGLNQTGNYFTVSENSGLPAAANAAVLQSYEERSNVDFAEQTTRMIRAQRAYQLASRVITTVDQMAALVNTIRS